jgi:hypothetical protein
MCYQTPAITYPLIRGSGAQGCLGVVPECASIANRVFASFLARLPPARSDPLPPHPARLDDALQRLSEIVHDPNVRSRDACSPMAFSCVPPAVVRRRMQIYARAAAGHRCAFSPLDNNGRPKRKYVDSTHSTIVGPGWMFTFGSRFNSDTRNGCRKSGLRWTGIGSPIQVCCVSARRKIPRTKRCLYNIQHNLRKLRRGSTSRRSTSAWKSCPRNSRASSP